MRGRPSILSLYRNEFNKITNIGARMLDSVYHMTLQFLTNRIHQYFAIFYATL